MAAEIVELKKPPVQVWYVKDAFGERFSIRSHSIDLAGSDVSFKFNGNLIAQFSDFTYLILGGEEAMPH